MLDHIYWRCATKKFDPKKKISDQEFDELLEVLRLSPSSFGLQPWKFIVVRDQELRKNLRLRAWDQSQLTDSSHVIIFCALKQMSEQHIQNHLQRLLKERGLSPEAVAYYEQRIKGYLKALTPDEISCWMKCQVYIALGMFLSECAHRRIDACPMEGFEPKKVDELLGLPGQGFESVVLCAVGYRAQGDQYAIFKKVRFDKSEVFIAR